jgi:amidase
VKVVANLLDCTRSIYSFSKDHAPVTRVPSGASIEIETYDCFTNQLKTTDQFQSLDWNQINPATGPIFVEGAEPGDVLAVKIERIELATEGVMAVGPGLGVLGKRLDKYEAKPIPIRAGKAIFNDDFHIPLNPMIGVIGVAPAGEAVSCGTPGDHGGNMDNKLITTGATVYFPVFVPGALFALGDLHAAMGDGEIGVSGIEVPGKVTVTLEVKKGKTIPSPMLENDDSIITIASAETLDEAVSRSVEQMADFLAPQIDLPFSELTMLLSAIGQTQICQVVDPLMTARFVVPKSMFRSRPITMF